MDGVIETINAVVWGLPTVLLILGVGIYFSIKTGFCQITLFPKAWRSFISKLKPVKSDSAGISGYQALCTALAATVGTGNIAGVAGAMALGGPGSIFWMWICAFLGMVIKCAEAILAVRYRNITSTGEFHGGPMQIIENGLGKKYKWLAVIYAIFGVVAAFGVGNATQINAVLSGIRSAASTFGYHPEQGFDIFVSLVLAILVALIFSGGARRIGKITQWIVPFASLAYILLGIGVLLVRFSYIPTALETIIRGAFSPQAVTGGIVGSIFVVCRTGASRGVFTNEAGMGTASIAHAAAEVKHPVEQGLMGIMEVFLDTIVICTITALVILCSGVQIPFGTDPGALLTANAFGQIYGSWVNILIALCLVFFAIATVIGWGYYGLRCAQYLFGENVFSIFIVFQMGTVMLAAFLKTGTVWQLAEIVKGLMAIPNLIALMKLSPVFVSNIREYKQLEVKRA